jgi:hypothetical protein
MRIEIDLLHENPLNAAIYGEDDFAQFAELVEKIKVSGYIYQELWQTNQHLCFLFPWYIQIIYMVNRVISHLRHEIISALCALLCVLRKKPPTFIFVSG